MKKAEIKIGSRYVAKISGKLTVVRLDDESPYGGWDATNVETKRSVRIRSAAKLRREFKVSIRKLAERAIAIFGKHEEAAGYDAGFDAGEFSGPAHDEMAEREIKALCAKYGVEYNAVMNEVSRLSNEPGPGGVELKSSAVTRG